MFSTHKSITRSILGFVLSTVIALQLTACGATPHASSGSAKSGSFPAASSSETEIKVTDERSNLSIWIPSDWDDIAIVETSTEFYEETDLDDSTSNTLLFVVYETLAHSKNDGIGYVWSITSIQKNELENLYGSDVDISQTIGVETRVIGTDGDTVYLLREPGDVQFIEDSEYLEPTESQLQYERLQKESQMVIDKFLKNNQIKVNYACPKTPCYSHTPTE